MPEKSKQKHVEKPIDKVFLRDYSKVIFFYPLFIASIILWIVELAIQGAVPWVGFVWLVIFFLNLFVIAFDISSTNFFIMLLFVVVVVILIIFLVVPNVNIATFQEASRAESEIMMSANFYLGIIIILGIIFIIAFTNSRLDYWKLERNEAHHRKGLVRNSVRYPVKGLRIKTDNPDIFEFILLRAGSITLNFRKNEIYHLNTIPNVHKKSAQIDYLLSHVEIEIDDLA